MKKDLVIFIIVIFGLTAVVNLAFAGNQFVFAGKIIKATSGLSSLPVGVPGTGLKVRAKISGKTIEKTVYIGGAVIGQCKKGNGILGIFTPGRYAVAITGICMPCKIASCNQ